MIGVWLRNRQIEQLNEAIANAQRKSAKLGLVTGRVKLSPAQMRKVERLTAKRAELMARNEAWFAAEDARGQIPMVDLRVAS